MTPLVLIPGMMCDARMFLPQIIKFNKTQTFIASISQYDNMEDLAKDVLLSAPPQFALCGLSMGGIVAMEIVRQSPQRVERLCLMDTNPLAEIDEVKACRQPQIDKAKAGFLEQIIRDEMKPNYLYKGNKNKQVLNLCMEMALKLGVDVFINQSIALKNRPDQTDTLKKFKNPTLILQGENDKLCPTERHELMHELIPHSRYTVIEKAGHLPTLENPDQTNEELLNWQTTY